jgi:hypothetical protein
VLLVSISISWVIGLLVWMVEGEKDGAQEEEEHPEQEWRSEFSYCCMQDMEAMDVYLKLLFCRTEERHGRKCSSWHQCYIPILNILLIWTFDIGSRRILLLELFRGTITGILEQKHEEQCLHAQQPDGSGKVI